MTIETPTQRSPDDLVDREDSGAVREIVVEEEASRQDGNCQVQPTQEEAKDHQRDDASAHEQRLTANEESCG
jgi:hypothetical protein